MEGLTDADIIRKLQKKDADLFTLDDFSRVFEVKKRNSLYKIVQRLEDRRVVKRLLKGKYALTLESLSEFRIANFLYRPSYVSLESALSFYGIITGFAYQITSVNPRKTKIFQVEGKEYTYSQITPDLFWGYKKEGNFLLADREKSVLDFLYLAYKGSRARDINEFELTEVNINKLKLYIKKTGKNKFINFSKKLL